MSGSLTIDGLSYSAEPIDISIPLQFNGPQPNAFGVEPAISKPCVSGDLVGDTRQGGSCNFERYTFIPHCNGTHTECVGHITKERIAVRDCLRDAFMRALVISVDPEPVHDTNDTYSPLVNDGDLLITERAVVRAMPKATRPIDALIVRTRPNDDSKLTCRYEEDIPPYFTTEAMEFIVQIGVEHLLVDLPSIDRLYDAGRLLNHHVFWNVTEGSFETTEEARRDSTITELIYVPDDINDGHYLLNLQIAPFSSDASPSRPLLFPLTD
ncbi:MAG TPA: cyclase family protein [Pyrinomonadaceae bacterium]|nr:cyclase family protein [Pyrinomonadaceae bacterium]